MVEEWVQVLEFKSMLCKFIAAKTINGVLSKEGLTHRKIYFKRLL